MLDDNVDLDLSKNSYVCCIFSCTYFHACMLYMCVMAYVYVINRYYFVLSAVVVKTEASRMVVVPTGRFHNILYMIPCCGNKSTC